MKNWNISESETDYQDALERIDDLIDLKASKSRDKELKLLGLLVESYEDEHFPFPDARMRRK